MRCFVIVIDIIIVCVDVLNNVCKNIQLTAPTQNLGHGVTAHAL